MWFIDANKLLPHLWSQPKQKICFGCSNSSSSFEIALISSILARSICINVFYDMFIPALFGTLPVETHVSERSTPATFDLNQMVIPRFNEKN